MRFCTDKEAEEKCRNTFQSLGRAATELPWQGLMLVCARLGPARVCGNAQPAAFNRQVAMYLAHRIGGWTTTRIGRFYNGRDHSTVCYAIKRIQMLRESNPEVASLVSSLTQELRTDKGAEVNPPSATTKTGLSRGRNTMWSNEMLDDLAERIASRLRAPNCG
jgi:Bacterial dnaA protein helix-turn-helix